jgi:hypothetical protein
VDFVVRTYFFHRFFIDICYDGGSGFFDRKRWVMHSDLISKIEKARQYAQEPERISIDTLQATFKGGNNDHVITIRDGVWQCDCDFFRTHTTCAHVMAMQKILAPMLSERARQASNPLDADDVVELLG